MFSVDIHTDFYPKRAVREHITYVSIYPSGSVYRSGKGYRDPCDDSNEEYKKYRRSFLGSNFYQKTQRPVLGYQSCNDQQRRSDMYLGYQESGQNLSNYIICETFTPLHNDTLTKNIDKIYIYSNVTISNDLEPKLITLSLVALNFLFLHIYISKD